MTEWDNGIVLIFTQPDVPRWTGDTYFAAGPKGFDANLFNCVQDEKRILKNQY